jgi:hypothetical protein
LKTPEQRAAVDQKREQRIRRRMLQVFEQGAETLQRLYLPDGHPNQHPDAKKTWSECSMQTRAALALAKAHGENPTADVKELFGIIVLQGRSKSALEWEQRAIKVEEEQKRKALEALAVTKEPPK